MKTGFPKTEHGAPATHMWEGRKHRLEEDLRFLHRMLNRGGLSMWRPDTEAYLDEYRIGAETFLMELERVDNETELEIVEPKLGAWKEDLYAFLLSGPVPDED